MAANQGSENSSQKYLAESIKRFSRSIELCDDYLRGYYGLKRVNSPWTRFIGVQLLNTRLGD